MQLFPSGLFFCMELFSVFNYEGEEVSFKKENGVVYVNMTSVAKKFPNKNLSKIANSDEITNYVNRLSEITNVRSADLLIIRKGGDVSKQGIWAHQKVALRIAQKLSVDFSIWVDTKIEELLLNGNVSLNVNLPDFTNPAEAARAWANQYEATQRAIAEKKQIELEKNEAIKTIEINQPKVEFADSFKEPGKNDMLIREVAKELEQNGVRIAERALRGYLKETRFMFINGQGKWELYSNVVRKGYGVYRSFYVDKYTGERVNQQTIYMTGSGYEVTLKAIKGNKRHIFEKYGEFMD